MQFEVGSFAESIYRAKGGYGKPLGDGLSSLAHQENKQTDVCLQAFNKPRPVILEYFFAAITALNILHHYSDTGRLSQGSHGMICRGRGKTQGRGVWCSSDRASWISDTESGTLMLLDSRVVREDISGFRSVVR